jgi:glycosyltransferase involved in cell wall biosynthesis
MDSNGSQTGRDSAMNRGAGPPDGAQSAAIVHDFFVTPGGAERCAVALADLLPSAPIYTSFFDWRAFAGQLDTARVRTWPIQRFVAPSEAFRALFPLYALYFGTLRLARPTLVVSSSIAFSKAVRTSAGATHISYVYTPMRYAWDLDTYLDGSSLPLPARLAARAIRPFMQTWDRRTARRPNMIVAISREVARRIERVWRREADTVIYPPVEIDEIPLGDRDDGYFMVAARLLAYRRVDLAVRACTKLNRRLIVVGDGPEAARLRSMAGPSVTFLGRVDRAELLDLLCRCHAYLMPGAEDFGIAPVEAMAAGKPVVAFARAGALETVIEGESGVFFHRQEADDLVRAIEELDQASFDPSRVRALASRFDAATFRRAWRDLLTSRGFGGLLASGGADHPDGRLNPAPR